MAVDVTAATTTPSRAQVIADGTCALIGVEEEYLVVDPITRKLAPVAPVVIARAEQLLGDTITAEFTRFQIEVKTEPQSSAGSLLTDLRRLRTAVSSAAAAEGYRIIASGAPPLGDMHPLAVSDDPRYGRGVEVYQALAEDLAICSCHVHVQLPNRELALQVSNHLRVALPTLTAMAANSPFWAGRDTGFASWRTILWSKWPVAGPPPFFTSAAHFAQITDSLLATGTLLDRGTLFWDIRPSTHVPTLEVRVADVPQRPEETVLLAAVIRSLASTAVTDILTGKLAPDPEESLLRAAQWMAAREGLEGMGVDLTDGSPVPAVQLVYDLIDRITPALREHGDYDQVAGLADQLIAAGSGAARQREQYRRAGEMADVVDHLVRQTSA
ncbi:YbdK family carboxylate-amine ligase [Pseudonocardiaceae bacterium YIM PH 21723]|nr:YbdK family carboxylate-amine ligase [Pseudonocardiaceae bacterium YIM PH 21723]